MKHGLALFFFVAGLHAQSAATGDFFVYGNGCPGTGAGLGTVLSNNGNASTTQPGSNGNQFTLKAPNTGSTPIVVLGFELWTTSITGNPQSLVTELYDEATPGGAPNLAPIRTGTMVVGNKAAFCRTTFAQPYILQPQAAVFLSYQPNVNILFSRTAVGGTLSVHYYRTPPATVWTGPFTSQPHAWRVLGSVSTGARPLISNTGVPTVGLPFQVHLAEARATALVTLGLGASNVAWSGLTLPFDLSVINMPGCKALASMELGLTGVTDPSGNATLSIVVPNVPSLSGAILFSQWYVLDPSANPFGLVNSDAAEVRIG